MSKGMSKGVPMGVPMGVPTRATPIGPREIACDSRFKSRLAALPLFCVLVSLGALLSGCPPPPPPRPVPVPRAETDEAAAAELLREARTTLGRGDRALGLTQLAEVTRRHPETEAADAARLNLGVAALEERRDGDAAGWLRELRRQPPRDAAEAERWHRALAQLEARSGRAADAQPHLEALVTSGAARETDRQLLAEILLRQERPLPDRALEVLVEVPADGGQATVEDQAAARERLRAILAERTPEELDAIAREAPADETAGKLVRIEQAERQVAAGQFAVAAETLESVDAGGLGPAAAETLAGLRERIESYEVVAADVVGVLLPLSGRFAAVGEQALRAVELAHALVAPGVTLVVKDTGGTTEGAEAAVAALVAEAHAIAALGPVGYQESDAAATGAEALGLPLVPFSAREDLADERAFVVRSFVTRRAEAQALARWAVVRRGFTRIAALYPDNPYGAELVEAFAAEVERLGAPLVGSVSYGPGETDLSKPLQALLGRRVPPKDDLSLAEVGFEALFVPDTPQPARRVASWLKYARVPIAARPDAAGVQLLGASGWDDAAIFDPAERLTDNAVFTAAFVPDGEEPAVDAFLRAFYDRHGVRPTSFQAECYDATALLLETVAGGLARDRVGLRVSLGEVRNWLGVTGVWTVLPDGRVRRSVPILTVDGEVIRPRLSEEEEAELRGR